MTTKTPAPINAYPISVRVHADECHTALLAGETYLRSGKVGIRMETGESAAEYASAERPGYRLWMTEAGEVYPE